MNGIKFCIQDGLWKTKAPKVSAGQQWSWKAILWPQFVRDGRTNEPNFPLSFQKWKGYVLVRIFFFIHSFIKQMENFLHFLKNQTESSYTSLPESRTFFFSSIFSISAKIYFQLVNVHPCTPKLDSNFRIVMTKHELVHYVIHENRDCNFFVGKLWGIGELKKSRWN